MISILEKETRVIFKVQGIEEKIIIPSSKYPLESKPYQLIHSGNTEPVTDNKIIEIFNSITPKVGHCFSNSGKLARELIDAGYDAKQYVGWVFTHDDYPVHHSFVMVNNHILDLSVEFLGKDLDYIRRVSKEKGLNKDGMRKLIIEYHEERAGLPNHIKCNFGKCDSMYLYCAAEGTETEGRIRNQKLRNEYPDHPAFKDVKNGMTKTQRMIYEKA